MRLYGKLLVMILAFALLQHYVAGEARSFWFAARCEAARLCGSTAMEDQLVAEARHAMLHDIAEQTGATAVVAAAYP
jgi:hypothetical protein